MDGGWRARRLPSMPRDGEAIAAPTLVTLNTKDEDQSIAKQ
jgi:hypothetical protein